MQTDHRNRINKVFEHIDKNLDSDLSLAVVSEIACFSPFHFHRVFKTITGETLNEYVTRRRIEKAASVLIHNRSIRIKNCPFKMDLTIMLPLPGHLRNSMA